MPNNSKVIIMNNMRTYVTKKKFDKVTVESITKSCNLTRGSFYYHFQNKYDLIEKMFLDDVGEFTYDTDDDFFDNMQRLLDALVLHREYYVEAFKVFEFRAFLYRFFESTVAQWLEPKSGISFDLSQKLSVTRLVSYGWTAYICKWGHEGFHGDTVELNSLFRDSMNFIYRDQNNS